MKNLITYWLKRIIFLVLIMVQVGIVYGAVEVLAGTGIESVESAYGHDKINSWKKVQNAPEILRLNPKFLDEITDFSDDLIKQLNDDLANPKWKDELTNAFKDYPEEVRTIWKELKDNPYSKVDFIDETTDPVWLKWKDREFFKAALEKGNKFNKHMIPRIRGDLEASGVNLSGATQIDELQTLPYKGLDNLGNPIYGKKVILDNGFVTEVRNVLGDLEYYKVLYNDNKFGLKSSWTPNQKSEVIHYFRDNPGAEYITLEIRTAKNRIPDGSPVTYTSKVRLYRKDIYKTLSDGNPDAPTFGSIINMNSKGFKD